MVTNLSKSRTVRVVIAVCAVISGVVGCASVLGIDSDRHVVTVDSGSQDTSAAETSSGDDGGEDGPDASDLPAEWRCLVDKVPDPPDADIDLEFFFNSASGAATTSGGDIGTPVAGAMVHACNSLDISCMSPFSPETSDDGGIALLTLPPGFSGYYEVQAPSFTPTILSRTKQISSEYQSQGMANLTLLSAGAGLAGLDQDPSLSIAIVTAFDCTTTPAAGISFQVANPGANEQVVYLVNNYPTPGATETDDVTGTALVFNVPSGTIGVTASFASTGAPIRTVTALARQNWVTYIDVRPDQASHKPIP